MTSVEKALLAILQSGLSGNTPEIEPVLDEKEWGYFIRLAQEQELLPLIADTIYSFSSFRSVNAEQRKDIQDYVLQQSVRQVIQTNEFLTLMLHAQSRGLDPVVLKGIVCRSLYPKPMLRPSVDEDLLILPHDTERWHHFLLSEGLFADEPNVNRKTAYELSYHRYNSPTYIELHKSLFSRTSEAYGDLNDLFVGSLDRRIEVQIEDVTLRTLAPTDHFLYLLCHAYKHFLHAGVGIRQVADMALFANAYGDNIDWEYVFISCQKVHIETFAAALLKIAHRYLTLKTVPAPFSDIRIEEAPLLEDILTGGLYGMTDSNRAHSGNLTLDAVAARRKGRRRRGVWHSLFPGKNYLQSHFIYAKKYPVLLPVAWGQRIIEYFKRSRLNSGNPTQTIQIGQARIKLLEKYKII